MTKSFSRRAIVKSAPACLFAGAIGAAVSTGAARAAPAGRAGAADGLASFPWPPQGRPAKPYVIGHRGAPAHRPELTLASFAKAIADGADFVEIDVMPTRDGELVVRHDVQLDFTTDVQRHPEFAAYRRTRPIYDGAVTAWFVDDFTLAELKTLRVVERAPNGGGSGRPEAKAYDGWFQILTFDEVNDFLDAMESIYQRKIGIVIELKMPSQFAGGTRGIADKLIRTLERSHYLRNSPVIVQSFEMGPLQTLSPRLSSYSNIRIQALLGSLKDRPADYRTLGSNRTWGEMLAGTEIARVKDHVHWLGVASDCLIPRDASGLPGKPSNLVTVAHDSGLLVSAWTFRPENRFLTSDLRSSDDPTARNAKGSVQEMRRHIALGLDGIITDDPALAREAVDRAGRATFRWIAKADGQSGPNAASGHRSFRFSNDRLPLPA